VGWIITGIPMPSSRIMDCSALRPSMIVKANP
jgi:hypothetical protein